MFNFYPPVNVMMAARNRENGWTLGGEIVQGTTWYRNGIVLVNVKEVNLCEERRYCRVAAYCVQAVRWRTQ